MNEDDQNNSFYENGQQNSTIVFIPHLDFVESGKFSFPQNEQNISPLSKQVPKV